MADARVPVQIASIFVFSAKSPGRWTWARCSAEAPALTPPPPKEERGEKREEETTLDKSEPPREADTLEADVVRK